MEPARTRLRKLVDLTMHPSCSKDQTKVFVGTGTLKNPHPPHYFRQSRGLVWPDGGSWLTELAEKRARQKKVGSQTNRSGANLGWRFVSRVPATGISSSPSHNPGQNSSCS